jgi:hypothetical protein
MLIDSGMFTKFCAKYFEDSSIDGTKTHEGQISTLSQAFQNKAASTRQKCVSLVKDKDIH